MISSILDKEIKKNIAKPIYLPYLNRKNKKAQSDFELSRGFGQYLLSIDFRILYSGAIAGLKTTEIISIINTAIVQFIKIVHGLMYLSSVFVVHL